MKRLIGILAALGLLLGVTTGTASARVNGPLISDGAYHISTPATGTVGWVQDNGSYNQLTITFGSFGATWNAENGQHNGHSYTQFTNNNGKCMKALSNNVVEITGGACVASDNAEWWMVTLDTVTGHYIVVNISYCPHCLLQTAGNSGSNVWIGVNGGNTFTEWDIT